MVSTILIIQYAEKMIRNPSTAEVIAFCPFAVVSGFPCPAPTIIEIPPKIKSMVKIIPATTTAVERIAETRSPRPDTLPKGEGKIDLMETCASFSMNTLSVAVEALFEQ